MGVVTRVQVGEWILDCDLETTREAYSKMPLGDPEQCGCLYCRNFSAARLLAYPASMLDLYSQLGIKADREAETYEAGLSEDGQRHLYGGWHHFVGRIKNDPGNAYEYEVAAGFSICFSQSRSCAEPVFGDAPLVQVEFFTSVPWLLDEHP